jgi:hypothetical protein
MVKTVTAMKAAQNKCALTRLFACVVMARTSDLPLSADVVHSVFVLLGIVFSRSLQLCSLPPLTGYRLCLSGQCLNSQCLFAVGCVFYEPVLACSV